MFLGCTINFKFKIMKKKPFYTYVHFNPGTRDIFYVGKGNKNRFKSRDHRNTHWHNTVNKYGGFEPKIIMNDLTEEESLELEIFMIAELGLDNLTNVSPGGDNFGGYDKTGENNPMWGKPHPNKGKKMPQNGLKGESHPLYGTSQSKESRKKNLISQPTRKPVLIDGIEYPSKSNASKILGIPLRTVGRRLDSINFKNYIIL